jgi:hypothetical protein
MLYSGMRRERHGPAGRLLVPDVRQVEPPGTALNPSKVGFLHAPRQGDALVSGTPSCNGLVRPHAV